MDLAEIRKISMMNKKQRLDHSQASISKEIGRRIRNRRKELGISLVEMGKSIGHESSTYARHLEQGTRSLKAVDLLFLARKLRIAPQKLLPSIRECLIIR